MKFFFPRAESPRHADAYWCAARLLLREAGFPTEPRRIQAVAFRRGEETRYLQVGMADADSGEEILLIFRAAGTPYYWVCTPFNGLLEGAPIPVPIRDGTWAIDFAGEEARRPGLDRRPAKAPARRRPGGERR